MRYVIGLTSIHRDLDRRRGWFAWPYVAAWTFVSVCALASYPGITAAQSQDSQAKSGQALQEVTVTAKRLQDHRTLARAVTSFVASHAAPATRTNQIGRWHEPVCPLITGLQPSARDFVTREILDVARGVGAPTAAVGKKMCDNTVEIVFTREPQALLDQVAKAYRPLLGFYPISQLKKMTTFSRPIQAWYETGTRAMDIQHPIYMGGGASGALSAFPEARAGNPEMPISFSVQVDSDVTAMGMQPTGISGSYMGHRVRSEFIHVLIIADSGQLAGYSMHSIADYLALLSLTRMSQLDQCAPLPSITDLLAAGCATPAADSLTAPDRAYLKGLYSADLEQNLNIERGDIHDQMMRQIEGK
jgi:hypothetical protein